MLFQSRILNAIAMLFWVSVVFLSPSKSYAHAAGITDTVINIGASKILLTYTVPVDDLNRASDYPKNTIADDFKLKNDDELCRVDSLFVKELGSINSKQFVMQFDCHSQIKNLSIHDDNLFDVLDGHINHTRVLLAGRTLNLRFSNEFKTHTVPVSQMLNLWGITLDNNAVTRVLTPESGLSEVSLEGIDQALYVKGWKDFISKGLGFFQVGLEHIVFGYDHLLFLIGLLLLPLSLKQLIYLVTSFSLAHSITLALSVLNIVSLPVWLVEAAIAGSIIYIAIENIFELRKSKYNKHYVSPWRRRYVLTFAFGLIHGFGFSFILREMAYGEDSISPLLFFNLGVEFGQLVIVAMAAPLIRWLSSVSKQYAFSEVCSLCMALLGSYWFVLRVC